VKVVAELHEFAMKDGRVSLNSFRLKSAKLLEATTY